MPSTSYRSDSLLARGAESLVEYLVKRLGLLLILLVSREPL
jgi:hypothetical protein